MEDVMTDKSLEQLHKQLQAYVEIEKGIARGKALTAAANMLRLFEGACGMERTADRLEAE